MVQAKAAGLVADRWEMRKIIAASVNLETFTPEDNTLWGGSYIKISIDHIKNTIMIKEKNVMQAFDLAAERYASLGVDASNVLEQMKKVSLSLHCWQADDVTGFENRGSLTGGIQVTGNYPGKARTIEELRSDVLEAKSILPEIIEQTYEIYGDFQGKKVDRDEVEPYHFQSWMEWGEKNIL